MRRREGLLAMAATLAGCAGEPVAEAPPPRPGQPMRVRVLQGGFLAPPMPAFPPLPQPGQPLRPPVAATGAFVRWTAPAALAMAGGELLVADLGTGRLWRTDTAGLTITAIAGAPVAPGVALALGPDLSAWVLDRGARQVLRFARDGRLMQTHRIGATMATPVALALADGGATLLLADGSGAAWAEQRGPQGIARLVAPQGGTGTRISGVDAIAVGAGGVFVLDRLLGVVHRVSREGRVDASFGRDELRLPVALALDRLDRIYVLDAQDGSVLRLRADAPALRWSAAELGLGRIAALAVDGLTMALADGLSGSVHLYSFAHDTGP